MRLAGLYADGPHFLGTAYAPFDIGGQARNNLEVRVGMDQLGARRHLLNALDTVDRHVDQTGLMAGLPMGSSNPRCVTTPTPTPPLR